VMGLWREMVGRGEAEWVEERISSARGDEADMMLCAVTGLAGCVDEQRAGETDESRKASLVCRRERRIWPSFACLRPHSGCTTTVYCTRPGRCSGETRRDEMSRFPFFLSSVSTLSLLHDSTADEQNRQDMKRDDRALHA
jgi:hypothetical protein